MASGVDPSPDSSSQDPYSVLGLEKGAAFEEIQSAREKLLAETGEDPLAKAKIEASYDALLMNSLKERQLGNVSSAAISASKKENGAREAGGATEERGSLLTRLGGIRPSLADGGSQSILPELALPEGQGLTIRLTLGAFLLLLLIVSPQGSAELILALSTIGVFLSQVRRKRRPLSSLGWSVVLLSMGLIIGGLLLSLADNLQVINTELASEKIESLPAFILLWAGSLFLA